MDNKVVRQILEKKGSFLQRHLILSPFTINELYKAKVLTLMDKVDLQEKSQHEQISYVTSILRQSRIDVFGKFLGVLQNSFDRWIAETLLDTKITFTPSVPILEEKTLREYLREFSEKKTMKTSKPEVPVSHVKPIYKSNSRRYQAVQLKMPQFLYHNSKIIPDKVDNGRGLKQKKPCPPSLSEFDHVTHQVHHLHRVFDFQKKSNDKTISILRQEQKAITDILTKNLDEQRHLERNQHTIQDITKRLDALHVEAGQLMKPKPSRYVTQSRLARLQDVIVYNDGNSF